MKTRWVMAACITVLFAFAGSVVLAQDRASGRSDQRLSQNRERRNHATFDDHYRQVIRDWYDQDKGKVLVGLRDPNPVLAADTVSTLTEATTIVGASPMAATRSGSSIRGRLVGATRMTFTSCMPMVAIPCTTEFIPAFACPSTSFSLDWNFAATIRLDPKK
jgi:hypothetical protein